MRVHLIATHPHYWDHLLAIWKHLPDQLRGSEYIGKTSRGITLPPEDLVMVAGFDDISSTPNRVIYVEHGSGQKYVGLPERVASYYHGGKHPDNVIAYLGPRREIIDAWGKPGYACGSPICDPYELFGEDGVVAITFHWNGATAGREVPEAGTALHHYIDHLGYIVASLRFSGYEVLGHRHPRLTGYENLWSQHNVPEVAVEEVRRRASCLIADNTSLLYEMSYLNRSVISLNAPWYRRDVEHGLRFWTNVPGEMVDGPLELMSVIERGLDTSSDWDVNQYVYGKKYSDGRDGLQAATWMTAFVTTI